ncbi:MAG: radical SAM protein [Bacilli bacterium]|nr:radical SAM protein [Bacilli bacterium]
MYKKVYIEITNNCNLDCTFCIKNHRKQKFMTEEEFRSILDKLKGHTKYLYFHLLGEPLLHPKLINFINLANANGFQVNITTNGYLIKRLLIVKILDRLMFHFIVMTQNIIYQLMII